MTVVEAKNYLAENWEDFIIDLIEENLDLLLEHEGISEEEIELKYSCFADLPAALAKSVWNRQEEHVQSNEDSYVNWFAKRTNNEVSLTK